MIFPIKKILILSLVILSVHGYADKLKPAGEAPKIYLQAGVIDLTKLLPPPPDAGSKENADEIKEILSFQGIRTPEMVDYAKKDQVISVFIANVLGDCFNETNLPFTAKFFKNIQDNIPLFTNPAKAYWNRPRPYRFDDRVKPCLNYPGGASYPSGHSSAGNLFAILLANMIPEKSSIIFNRGWEFAINRVIGGVHYHSDAVAGRISATLIAQELFKDREFMRDYARSKLEIRDILKIDEKNP